MQSDKMLLQFWLEEPKAIKIINVSRLKNNQIKKSKSPTLFKDKPPQVQSTQLAQNISPPGSSMQAR